MTQPLGPDGPARDGPQAGVPTCYRHPGRETYVRCARCDRPICPDCMTSAAVGFQCPECIRDGRASVREARTLAGGRVGSRPGVVTRTIVYVTVGVFVLQVLSGEVTRQLALVNFAVAAGEWYRLITVTLVHGSILHVAFNMYALWLVGQQVEVWLGRWRFLTLYLVSALAGSSLSYAFGGGYSVGASGAIFGVFGALAVLYRRLGYDPRPALALIVINLALTFAIPTIDWHAHVGGLVAGVLLTLAFAYAPRRWRTQVAVATTAVLVVVSLGLVAGRTATLRQDPRQQACIQQVSTCLKLLQTDVSGL
ncbi:MAG TPA: rhomboid family intramembrane serine protease [Actinomycetes bacterium]|nr:rhomboid family intramembrane serine protease [Actinomycetes bacterium]